MTTPAHLSPPYFGRRSDIYFNLTRGVWSVRAAADDGPTVRRGIVTGHAHALAAFNCRPRVSAAGRARVIRERRKNVHAFIGCETFRVIDPTRWVVSDHTPRVTYNPYLGDSFVDASDRGPLPAAVLPLCVFLPGGRVFYSDRVIRAGGFQFLDPWTFSDWADRVRWRGPVDVNRWPTDEAAAAAVRRRVDVSAAVA